MLFPKSAVVSLTRATYSRILKRFSSNKVRVRFAPSPTGFLHLGGLRTALYNYLFAKAHNGVNILRIEDTDLSRKIPAAVEGLLEDLAWCGITYDEDPYIQSERKEIYKKYTQQLIEQGDAYYCFCSSVRLDLLRREALKLGEIPRYDNCCRNLSKEQVEKNFSDGLTHCVRFKLTSFSNTFDDLICGPKINDVAAQEGDPIILKQNGFPTYHLANVVDDHLMNISHVFRGMEWLLSTTKHVLLYRAFKWDPPLFGHIPLMLNEDGKKFSKRQGDVHVRHYKNSGYFPNSLINFVIRFGGGFDIKSDQRLQIFTLDELIEKFDISKIKKSSCTTNLKWLPEFNQAEITRMLKSDNEKKELIKKTQEMVKNHYSEFKNDLQLGEEHVENVLNVMKHRITTLENLLDESLRYLWVWENNWNESSETHRNIIKSLLEKIDTVNWTQEDLTDFLKTFAKEFSGVKYSHVMQTIRSALTGSKVGAGVAEIMTTFSKEEIQFRLSKALEEKNDRDSVQK